MMPRRNNRFSFASGFGLVEIVIGAALVTGALLGAMTTARVSSEVISDARRLIQANFLLEEAIEAVKIARDNTWAGIIETLSYYPAAEYYLTFNGSSWTFNLVSGSPPLIQNMFTRKVRIEKVCRDGSNDDIIPGVTSCGSPDEGARKVTVIVSWPGRRGTETRSLSTYITNLFGN